MSRALKRELTSLVAAECERLREGFTTRDIAAALPTLDGKRVRRTVSMLLLLGWILPIGEINDGVRRFIYRWHGRAGALSRRPPRTKASLAERAAAASRDPETKWRARIGDRARFNAALTAIEVAQLRRITQHGAQAEQ